MELSSAVVLTRRRAHAWPRVPPWAPPACFLVGFAAGQSDPEIFGGGEGFGGCEMEIPAGCWSCGWSLGAAGQELLVRNVWGGLEGRGKFEEFGNKEKPNTLSQHRA